jgi:hypothetical protein
MEAIEDLNVWKRSSRLAIEINRSLKGCKDYILRDQLMRSVL